MSPAVLSNEFDLDIYNALPSVEKADSAVKLASRFDDFVPEASKLFRSHKVESRFGIALLHIHSEIEPGEQMVEATERIDGRDALVTKPTRAEFHKEHKAKVRPTVWQMNGDDFVPLEFSTDRLACGLLDDGEIPDAFLTDLKSLLGQSPIGRHLGLAVVFREFYKLAARDEIPVEFTKPHNRSNVVLLCAPDEIVGNEIIETAWSFEANADEKGCTSTCRRQCWAEDPHRKEHTTHHIP
jgi:hypothetical protein